MDNLMINFTIRQLEIFHTVAHQLSFTKASDILHLTQPAISRQIHNLEKQCEKPLFEQIGKRIYLTEMGNFLLQCVERTMQEIELLKTSIAERDNELKGSLNLCTTNGFQHLIIDKIGLFSRKYPKVDFHIFVGNSDFIFDAFNNNKIDFCLMSNNAINKINLGCEFLAKFPLTLMVSSENPLSKKKNIDVQLLSNQNFIVGEVETTCYEYATRVISKLKKSPKKIMQIKNFETVKHAVKADLGIAFIPPSIATLEIKENLLKAISINNFPSFFFEMYWVQHVNKYLSPAGRVFKEFLFKKLGEQADSYNKKTLPK